MFKGVSLMTDKENRRSAVRTTDRLLLAYKRVSREKFTEIAADYHQGVSLYTQEGLSDVPMYIGAQAALDRLRQRDADLADFLGHLDNKINFLLKKAEGENTVFAAMKLQKADLSGGGIAFHAFEKFKPGDIVEFHLTLLPSHAYLYFLAQVISCKLDGDRQGKAVYRVSAEFTLIMDEDREKVVQHGFKKQSLALRSRRQQNE